MPNRIQPLVAGRGGELYSPPVIARRGLKQAGRSRSGLLGERERVEVLGTNGSGEAARAETPPHAAEGRTGTNIPLGIVASTRFATIQCGYDVGCGQVPQVPLGAGVAECENIRIGV
jgi:hypothetical protein